MKWKDIAGWEGYFQVSDTGEVKSLERRIVRKNGVPLTTRSRNMRVQRSPAGYPVVRLNRDGGGATFMVHRLVAEAFIPNPGNLPVVRHLNDVKTDNRVENLAWGNWTDNMNDLIRNDRHFQVTKTQCSKGHPFSGENLWLYTRKDGGVSRVCKECRRNRSQEDALRVRGKEPPNHGTYRSYNTYRCRCEECKSFMRRKRAEKQKRVE